MLTKKHFEAIAQIINKHYRDPNLNQNDRLLIALLAADLSDYFDSENDRFQCQKFMNACVR